MKSIDLSPLVKNDIQYQSLVESAENAFWSEWDDAVHESYRRYVEQAQERKEKVHSIRCEAEELAKEVEELQLDELIDSANRLEEEARTV